MAQPTPETKEQKRYVTWRTEVPLPPPGRSRLFPNPAILPQDDPRCQRRHKSWQRYARPLAAPVRVRRTVSNSDAEPTIPVAERHCQRLSGRRFRQAVKQLREPAGSLGALNKERRRMKGDRDAQRDVERDAEMVMGLILIRAGNVMYGM